MLEFDNDIASLLGLGVMLQREQAAMLEDPYGGLALYVRAVPDPVCYMCDCGLPPGGDKLNDDANLVDGKATNLVIPSVMEFTWEPESIETDFGTMEDWLSDWAHEGAYRFPSLFGTTNELIDMRLEQLPMVARLWDCWPIDVDQARVYKRAENEWINESNLPALNELGQVYHGWWEPDDEDEDDKARLKLLERECGIEKEGDLMELRLPGRYALPREEMVLWYKLRRTSMASWTNLQAALDDASNRFYFNERAFSPWF